MLNTKFWSLLSLFTILLFWACSDDTTATPPPPNALDYLPLEVGAYWVYGTYAVSSDGTEIDQGTDTLSVTASYADGEDIIYELGFPDDFLFSSFFPNQLRLSDGQLIAENGDLVLTVDDNNAGTIVRTDSLSADLGFVYYRLLAETEEVTVPAGTFTCINFEGEIVSNNPEDEVNGKRMTRYYAEGVGLVDASNFFFNSGGKVGIRLLSYELP